jgi:hypothetical protein
VRDRGARRKFAPKVHAAIRLFGIRRLWRNTMPPRHPNQPNNDDDDEAEDDDEEDEDREPAVIREPDEGE